MYMYNIMYVHVYQCDVLTYAVVSRSNQIEVEQYVTGDIVNNERFEQATIPQPSRHNSSALPYWHCIY